MKPNFDVRKATTAGLASALAIASGTSAYGAIVNATPPSDNTVAPGGTTLTFN